MIDAAIQIVVGLTLLIINRPLSGHCRSFQKRVFGLEYTEGQFRGSIIAIALILVVVGVKGFIAT